MNENKEVTSETPIANGEDTGNGEEQEVNGEETEPEYDCAILIRSKLSIGEGVEIVPVLNDCVREATNEDIIAMVSVAHSHVQSNLIRIKLLQAANAQRKLVVPKGRVR